MHQLRISDDSLGSLAGRVAGCLLAFILASLFRLKALAVPLPIDDRCGSDITFVSGAPAGAWRRRLLEKMVVRETPMRREVEA